MKPDLMLAAVYPAARVAALVTGAAAAWIAMGLAMGGPRSGRRVLVAAACFGAVMYVLWVGLGWRWSDWSWPR